jgi:hypothetical protein
MKLCKLFVTRNLCLQGRVVDHAVSRRIFTREAGGLFQASPHNVSGLKSDTVTSFSLSNSVLSCHCHSTYTPYSSLLLPKEQKNEAAYHHTKQCSSQYRERIGYESDCTCILLSVLQTFNEENF